MKKSIFRPEALEANAEQLNGEPFLQYPLHTSLIVNVVVVVALVSFVFCFVFDLTQKESATGFLEPEGGLIEIFPEHSGVLVSKLPSLGTSVHKGQALATLQSQPQVTDLGTLSPSAEKALNEKIASLQLSIGRRNDIASESQRSLQSQKEALENIISLVGAQLTNIARQIEIKETLVKRGEALATDRYVAADFVDQRRLELREVQSRQQELQKELAKAKKDLAQINSDLNLQRLNSKETEQSISRELMDTQASIAERQQARNFEVKAPVDGAISGVHKLSGQFAAGNTPIFTLTPAGAKMRGVLLLPAKAAAFVKINQTVSIRYAAFPHQYFGSFPGIVRAVETIPYKNGNASNDSNAATYRVFVEIPQQSVPTVNGLRPLSAGMPIEADIWLVKRRLIDWLVLPVYEFFVKK